jgi:predicted RNA binding protein YcfA (HicA-like mRNA interferase family)
MKLPHVSGLEVIKRLKRIGFIATRQKGSHVRLEKSDEKENLKITVPLHPELKAGTLHRILKDANISVEDFDKIR